MFHTTNTVKTKTLPYVLFFNLLDLYFSCVCTCGLFACMQDYVCIGAFTNIGDRGSRCIHGQLSQESHNVSALHVLGLHGLGYPAHLLFSMETREPLVFTPV